MISDLLTEIRINVLEVNKNMTWLIKETGVSRDTFYKKIRQNDQEFINEIFEVLKNFEDATDENK